MATSERKRRELYESAEASWGAERVDTLMEMLPPVGWADVATKQDLGALEIRIDAGMDRVRAELHREVGAARRDLGSKLAAQSRELTKLTRWMAATLVSAVISAVGVAVVALAQLL